jgi:hypothetical protein
MKRALVGCAVAVWVVGVVGAPSSSAYEPRAATWKVVEASPRGEYSPGVTPGGDARVQIELASLSEFGNSRLLVVFPECGEDPSSANRPILNLDSVLKFGVKPRYAEWEDPGPRWRVCASDSAFLVDPAGSPAVFLSVDFLRDVSEGLSPRLPVKVFVLSEDDIARIDFEKDIGCQWANIVGRRSPTADLTIDLYYRLDGAKHVWFMGDYADIFGRPDPDPLFGRSTGDYKEIAAQLPVDVLSFRSNRRIPGETEDDGGKLFQETLRRVLEEKSALSGGEVCNAEDIDVHLLTQAGAAAKTSSLLASPNIVAASYQVSGRFSTKWSADHSLHPGFGFRVEAWSNDFLGIWIKLAEDWVQSDGTWHLNVPGVPIFSGNRLRVYYRTKTSYYDVQDLSNNHYVWVDPDWLNIAANFNVGHRFADTDGGTYNGVGEVVDAAMYTWSRLYWNGGVNPVPASPINIFAPNTTYDCGDGSGNPWSCASRDGNIWLIAAHAVQAQVVSHELGHQLNYKFWNNKNPANTGGGHSLNSCYPLRLGTTLFEGFADFLAGWVGYPGRNVADGGFGSGRWALSWDLESRNSPPSCTNGWENEVWVARTFWDLNDTRGDGSDVLWFNNLGAVPVLYLANGVANNGDARDMRFYENIYRNAASPGHQNFISDIFDQNRH